MTLAEPTVGAWRWRMARGRAAPALVAVMGFVSPASGCGAGAADPPAGAGQQATGSRVQADALGNTVIGGAERTALAFRFRASWTGSVAAVRFYVIKNVGGRTGYSSGDGGVMRVTLEADSGRRPHVPSGRILAKATFRPASAGVFPLLRFEPPGRTVAGRLYHVRFVNVDRRPERNYVSINALYSASRVGRGPAAPDGLAVLDAPRNGTGAWRPRRSRPHEHYVPILEVVGTEPGQHEGLGYMEVWRPKPVGGGAMVRQLVRAPGPRPASVVGAWLRLRRARGSDTSLVVSLRRPDGRPLVAAAVPPRRVPTDAPGWVYVRFPRAVSLAPDADLALTASAARPSSYSAFPLRKGDDYGFDDSTYFDGGYAQFNDGSGWVGWDQWGGHDRRNSDLQFALDLAE